MKLCLIIQEIGILLEIIQPQGDIELSIRHFELLRRQRWTRLLGKVCYSFLGNYAEYRLVKSLYDCYQIVDKNPLTGMVDSIMIW